MTSDDSLSNQNPDALGVPATPVWQKWERINRCKLWEAVVLACNVDPSYFEPYGLNAEMSVDSVLVTVPPSIKNMLGLAKIAVASGVLKPLKILSEDLMQSEIDLSEFTAWLQMLGHKPPVGFSWTARELKPSSYQWPWGSYQTTSLQLLAQAADKFWKHYDPHDASTAPKNEDVRRWLEEKGMSSRMAEIVATMLRADNLPAGRR